MKPRERYLPFFITALLGLALLLDIRIDRLDSTTPAGSAATTDLLRSFLGNLSYEIRGLISRVLYLKIDRYVHEGKKLDFGNGLAGVTMIGNSEIVPLYGLITFLDPHFHEAFSLGGSHLIYGLGKEREGVELLELGIRLNPEDPLTSELLGQLAVYRGKDEGHPEVAAPLFARGYELRVKADPEKVPEGFIFSPAQLAGLAAVASFRAGDRESARRWLEKPTLLPPDHEIFSALGIAPRRDPPQEPHGAADPGRAKTRHSGLDHDHEDDGPDPRYWLDSDRLGRFSNQLSNAGLLVALLGLPGLARGAGRAMRGWASRT